MKEKPKPSGFEQTCELLISGDGNIFAHNLTPAMAELLAELNPNDADMRQRATPRVKALSQSAKLT